MVRQTRLQMKNSNYSSNSKKEKGEEKMVWDSKIKLTENYLFQLSIKQKRSFSNTKKNK